MNFNLKDIVLTTHEYGNRKLTIVAIEEGFYWAKEGTKKYKITDEQIQHKVGVVTSIEEEQPPSIEQQERFCLSRSKVYAPEKDSWLYLSRLRSGDKIKLIHRNCIHVAVFVQINLEKPLRPIRVNLAGRLHDFSLRSLVF
jgi:ribosomal protein S17